VPKRKRRPQGERVEQGRLLEMYRLLVHSIREAQSLQTIVDKERQMRRILRYLRAPRPT
jgi:hypothetical protein